MPVQRLPDCIRHRKGCVALFNDPKTGKAYSDEKSIFRCTALHRRRQMVLRCKSRETLTESERTIRLSSKACYRQWCKYKGISDAPGITLTDLRDFERALSITIVVWRYRQPKPPPTPLAADPPMETEGVATELEEQLIVEREEQIAESEIHRASLVYANRNRNPDHEIMNVNVFTDDSGANHFSYITDRKAFCLNHICDTCGWCFERKSDLANHQRSRKGNCNKQEHLFPGNGAEVSPTLFERLADIQINVEDSRRYFPYFAVFDCETCCDDVANTAMPFMPISTDPHCESLLLDPESAPSDVTGVLRCNWSLLRTQIAPDISSCVIRAPIQFPQLRTFARFLAQHQTKCFTVTIKALKCNRWTVIQSEVGRLKSIRNEADFTKAVSQMITRTHMSHSLSKALAVRLEVTESFIPVSSKMDEMHLLSIATASNVPGHETATFICRTKDEESEADIVHDFVDELHRIQATSKDLMTMKFQAELDELESRLEQHRLSTLSVFTNSLVCLQDDIQKRETELSDSKLELLNEGLRNNDNGPEDKQREIEQKEAELSELEKRAELVKQAEDAYSSIEKPEKFRLKREWFEALGPKACSDYFFYHYQHKQTSVLLRDLKAYCRVLPVLGFNSGKFDIGITREWLFPYLQDQQKSDIHPLKRGTKYLQITTERLRFLDISNYCGPCTSYDQWVKAYTGKSCKGVLCYEYLKRPSVLLETQLPPREAFDSKLKGFVCSEEQHAGIQRIWQEQNMHSLFDYLRYYNLLDVEPFVDALKVMLELWKNDGHDMLNNVCTLPGLADRLVRKNFLPKHTNLVLPQRVVKIDKATCATDNSDLYYTLKRSIVGGPACVYHRLHIAGQTKLRGGSETCAKIIGLDCNGLYLDSAQKDMPTQVPVRYWKAKPTDEYFQRRSIYPNWQSQTQWLEWKAHELNANIRHQFNSAKPLRVGGQQPDGYDAATKTVFFLDGCRFHGHGGCIANPNYKFPDGLDPQKKRQKDYAIRECLRERGFNVVEIKECEWMQLKLENPRASQLNPGFVAPKRLGREFKPPRGTADAEYAYDPTLREFLNEHFSLPKHGRMSERKLLAEIRRGRFFGFIVCDINVPEHLRERFADFEPIFKNVEVGPEHLDENMRAHLKRTGKSSKPHRMLVNSFFAKDYVLLTSLARWYLEKGLEISNIREAWEYKPKAIYVKFAERVSYHRREADAHKSKSIFGDEWKLRGNSIYGKTLTTVEKHTDTRICSRRKCALAARNRLKFVRAESFGDGNKWFEVCERKAKVTHNLFTAFGACVYQYSKLRMLQFFYDFLDYYWERKDYQLMYVDTDSFYVAISSRDLESFKQKVRPDRAAEFALDWNNYLAFDEMQATNEKERKWAAFDKRKVGLFKIEKMADRMCALAPKSYACANNDSSKLVKFSAKGVMRAQNNLKWESFYNVLRTHQPLEGKSITLARPHKSQRICKIETEKRLLSYDFYKRKLADDGITTFPLGL